MKHILKNNENLHVELFIPDTGGPRDKIEAIRNMILQPSTPWISEVERTYLEKAMEGCFINISSDHFFVAWICDDEKVEIIRMVGFQHASTLAGEFRAGDDQYDLERYICS